MFAARLGVGLGEATCAPAANSLIGDLYPSAQRARALAFFMLGLPLGNFLGTFVSGLSPPRTAGEWHFTWPAFPDCSLRARPACAGPAARGIGKLPHGRARHMPGRRIGPS